MSLKALFRILKSNGSPNTFLPRLKSKNTESLFSGRIFSPSLPESSPSFIASMAGANVSNKDTCFSVCFLPESLAGRLTWDTTLSPACKGLARNGFSVFNSFPFSYGSAEVVATDEPLHTSLCCKLNKDLSAFLFCLASSILSARASETLSFQTGVLIYV
ncbi:hypothetical protein MIMGU_mgv1a015400mg [Erythranthe guttata]|uniref:Uncharacterized protein n=1 Tax=Erythranthe guttata TaxID=4155 RepID=A0A022RED5_ERYGU|nr:hypothetical protein MIMGU_mgv1a015400mg [Erythranthe guttata]